MTRPIVAKEVAPATGHVLPEPFTSRLGPFQARELGDPCGISQFGISMETLEPGSQSAVRHWHTKSDEFVYLLEGALPLITDEGNVDVREGMYFGFKAGGVRRLRDGFRRI